MQKTFLLMLPLCVVYYEPFPSSSEASHTIQQRNAKIQPISLPHGYLAIPLKFHLFLALTTTLASKYLGTPPKVHESCKLLQQGMVNIATHSFSGFLSSHCVSRDTLVPLVWTDLNFLLCHLGSVMPPQHSRDWWKLFFMVSMETLSQFIWMI